MRKSKTLKKSVLVGLGLICLNQSFAQQDPQYTQYMYNPSVINPAYAGSTDHLQIFGLYRTQWIGLTGAPKTAHLSVTTPLNESGLGLGVHLKNDHLGVMDENSLAVDLAYTVALSYQYKLAFGLKGTGSLLDINYDKLTIYGGTDPIAESNVNNKFAGNVGAGVYLYGDRAYVGLSAPQILSSTRYNDNDYSVVKDKVHFYLMGGYVFEVNPNIQFKPAALMKAVSGAPLQVDLTANALFYDKFTLGVAYRWDAAVSGLAGFQITEGLLVGYTYDADINSLAKYNSGSHEIFLKFDLFKNYKKKLSPRFF
ncbi:type IX secretion system membrane protein PorP/SprF [Myroides sp. 1354]|uniref:PorP/SprF family type IX secretion system membrane protein n=1 Tax=unclassified Myroides TaxID=2642485 RepID=UPI002575BFE7|nr:MULTISPECIES: type IX secretion system membrane protein PorP/SprF [unclassified Myroides]MDM1046450.1 type IX secretion system membrane protein PorP/SprF [Myroides sp. R163-1]MDM1057387.1 type IX secretion system membrane protein PorP/SprF [Myroides sp. 1354]MDM1070600.1 type IX secretion system membrane protein PorP/SprF [Myroides sp. 1372]